MKKTNKTKEIAEVEPVISQTKDSAEMLISRAIDKNVPVETMERLLAMRRELKAEFAKEEFDSAMAKFQAECPEIKKTKAVRTKTGQLAYKYAPIEAIVRQVKGVLEKNGFSYSIQTEVGENKVKSICIVKHISGHSESYDMEVPLGNKTPVMSDSQVVAAASTFSKRYAFCNAFGILTGDEDDDGRSLGSGRNSKVPTSPDKMKEMAIAAIDRCDNVDKLLDLIDRVRNNKNYDKKMKDEIIEIANKKANTLADLQALKE